MVATPGRTSERKARLAPRSSPAGDRSDAALRQAGFAAPSGGLPDLRKPPSSPTARGTGMVAGAAGVEVPDYGRPHGHQSVERRMEEGSNSGPGERFCPPNSTFCPPKSNTQLARKLFSSEFSWRCGDGHTGWRGPWHVFFLLCSTD